MSQVTISPKFQIVIPWRIRDRLGLRPGQRMTLLDRDGVIAAIPDQSLEQFRGILKGMPRKGLREKRERVE